MSNARHTPISNLNIVSVSGSSGGVLDKTEAHIHVQCDGGTVDEICRMLRAAPELLAALESALLRLQTISGLMEDQVDQKLDGKRTRYNYKAAALQMNEEALAEIEDARAAILRVKGEQ